MSMDDTVHRLVFFSFNFFVRFPLVDGNESKLILIKQYAIPKNAKQEQWFGQRRMTQVYDIKRFECINMSLGCDSKVKNHNFMFRIIYFILPLWRMKSV